MEGKDQKSEQCIPDSLQRKRGVMGSKRIQRLTGVAVVEEGSSAATAGQEGQRRRHEPLHDAALPRAETQAAG